MKSNVFNKMDFKKNDYSIFYFYVFLIALIFNVNSTSNRVDAMYVYYTQFNTFVTIFGICAFFGIISLFRRPFLDNTSLALLYSAVLGLVPLLYDVYVESYWGNYIPILVSFASYYICMKADRDFTIKIYKICCFACVIIFAQVLATEFGYFSSISIDNISNVTAKAFMSIPIGNSNYIAAYLLPLIVFIYTFRNNSFATIISAISFYGIILCRSKNAIALALLIIFFVVFRQLYSIIIKNKSLHFFLILLIIAFVIASILVLNIIITVITDLQFDYNSFYENPILNYLDTISSGRIAVLEKEFIRFLDHPFFGNGFGYYLGQSRSHNWILELFVQRGLVGTIIYFYCVVNVIKNGLRFYNIDRFVRASINLLFIIHIQGLSEITHFTIGIDFLIWSISGFLVARIRYLSKSPQMLLQG